MRGSLSHLEVALAAQPRHEPSSIPSVAPRYRLIPASKHLLPQATRQKSHRNHKQIAKGTYAIMWAVSDVVETVVVANPVPKDAGLVCALVKRNVPD